MPVKKNHANNKHISNERTEQYDWEGNTLENLLRVQFGESWTLLCRAGACCRIITHVCGHSEKELPHSPDSQASISVCANYSLNDWRSFLNAISKYLINGLRRRNTEVCKVAKSFPVLLAHSSVPPGQKFGSSSASIQVSSWSRRQHVITGIVKGADRSHILCDKPTSFPFK